MNISRKVTVALSLALSLTSFLFYQFSGLFFILEETGELYAVKELASQGGDENALIAAGFVIFLLLAIYNMWRVTVPIVTQDIVLLLLALSAQGIALLMIEVGSFPQSLQASNGWILMVWLFAFVGLWLLLIAMMASK